MAIFTNPKTGEAVESSLSAAECMAYLSRKPRKNSFAFDLIARYNKYGRLSEGQWFWAHKLAGEVIASDARAAAPAAVAAAEPRAEVARTAAAVRRLFNNVGQTLKRPSLKFKPAGLGEIRIRPDRRRAGELAVYQGGRFRAAIAADGVVRLSNYADADFIAWFDRFAADPVAVAAEAGREAGCCCFCSKPLTDERSTLVGYGPICARHWALPWGEDRSDAAADLAEAAEELAAEAEAAPTVGELVGELADIEAAILAAEAADLPAWGEPAPAEPAAAEPAPAAALDLAELFGAIYC